MSDLDDILNGYVPPSDEPKQVLERPGYNRNGLYGRTPFEPRETKVTFLAEVMEQTCTNCGQVHTYFLGLFVESHRPHAVIKTASKGFAKDNLEEVRTQHEAVPFCPSCLPTTFPTRVVDSADPPHSTSGEGSLFGAQPEAGCSLQPLMTP